MNSLLIFCFLFLFWGRKEGLRLALGVQGLSAWQGLLGDGPLRRSDVHSARLAGPPQTPPVRGQGGERPRLSPCSFLLSLTPAFRQCLKNTQRFSNLPSIIFYIINMEIKINTQRWFCGETAGNNERFLYFDTHQKHLRNLLKYTRPSTSWDRPWESTCQTGWGGPPDSSEGALSLIWPHPQIVSSGVCLVGLTEVILESCPWCNCCWCIWFCPLSYKYFLCLLKPLCSELQGIVHFDWVLIIIISVFSTGSAFHVFPVKACLLVWVTSMTSNILVLLIIY